MNPPRRWLAAALNLIFPPAGYVYLGAIKMAALLVLVVVIVAVGLTIWSLGNPPGVYGLGPWSEGSPQPLLFGLGFGLLAAIHAMFLKLPATRPTGLRLWGIAITFWLLPVVLGGLARAFSPLSFYSIASASNEPGLAKGDIVAVRGARAICGDTPSRAGDMVIYRRDDDPVVYIHRIVAEAGQSVGVRGGRLIIDGKPVTLTPTGKSHGLPSAQEGAIFRETLPNGVSYEIADMTPYSEGDIFAAVAVPANHVFILGDNRDNALDSRFRGAVPLRNVCGVAFKVLQTSDKARIGQRP